MASSRLTSLAFILAALPLLTACNQTATPAAPASDPEPVGSGLLAAIEDSHRTRARHRLTSAVANQAAGFDPTGLSGFALGAMEEEQARIEDEKHQRIEQELEKALAEAEALRAQGELLERQETDTGRRPRQKVTP
jgi:hypothetical protein